MVLLSFLLQLVAIGVLRQYRTRPGEDNFGFGFEMGRVGRSIALGQGFSNPYGGNTGPTAWEPPLYPYLIGGVFKVFGVYTYASAWVLLSINSLFAIAHHHSSFSDCAPNLRPTRRTLVGRSVGA